MNYKHINTPCEFMCLILSRAILVIDFVLFVYILIAGFNLYFDGLTTHDSCAAWHHFDEAVAMISMDMHDLLKRASSGAIQKKVRHFINCVIVSYCIKQFMRFM